MLVARKCTLLLMVGMPGKLFGLGTSFKASSTLAQAEPVQCKFTEFDNQILHVIDDTSAPAFVEILKLCTKLTSVEYGNLIYFTIVENFLETNLFIGTTVISLYGNCHCIEDADSVFTKMPEKNVVTWNGILSGHAKHGQHIRVLYLFQRMQLEGFQPDKFTYVSILKACSGLDFLGGGSVIHTLILAGGFQEDVYVASAVVHMYASCCSFGLANTVFKKIETRNVVTWNALITGYIKDGQNHIALMIFQQMQHEKVQPDDATLINVLKAITNMQSIFLGMIVHSLLIEINLDFNVTIGTTLLSMYAACDGLKEAEMVFERLSKACPVLWTALLTGYVHCGSNVEALSLFKRMLTHGLALNRVIYLSLLKACIQLALASVGMLVYALIIESGCEKEEFIKNALIGMRLNFGSSTDAGFIFNSVPTLSVITWSTMIEGYAELGCAHEALALFQQMLLHGARPNNVIYLSVLKACSSLQALNEGSFVHARVRTSSLIRDLAVDNTLIDMYAKCGSIAKALQVFDEMPKHSVPTWNAIISGYLHHNDGWNVLCLFQSMQKEGAVPDNVTLINLLKTCCILSAPQEGRLLHIYAMHRNMDMDTIFQSALIDFHVKHGSLEDAERQFNFSSKQYIATCNAMITGYAHHGCCQKAFDLHLEMLKKGIMPDIVTFIGLLRACSETAALVHGKLTHQFVMQGNHSSSLIIENALIDMYAKCGSMPDAQKLFNSQVNRDVISWTAIITGHAIDGEIGIALQYLVKMQEEGFKPNEATFASILSGWGRIGLVDRAVSCLEGMTTVHTVLPGDDHHNTMVDVLGRHGHLMEAEDYMKSTPYVTNTVGWGSLISHCNTHVSVSVGTNAFEEFVHLDNKHASAYLQMAVLLIHARG